MRPAGAVHPRTAAVTVAVMRGARTVRAVRDATGFSISTAWVHLHAARAEGLVKWETDKTGTMRPGLGVAAILD